MVGEVWVQNEGQRVAAVRLTAPQGFTLDRAEFTLEPEAPATCIEFTFEAPQLKDWSGHIIAHVEGADAVQARVLCAPEPVLELASKHLEMSVGAAAPLSLALRHLQGGPAVVERANCESGRFQVECATETLQRGGELRLALQPAPAFLAEMEAGSYEERLTIDLLHTGPIELACTINVQEPPRLELSHAYLALGDVLPGRQKRRSVRLTNRGAGLLRIEQISLQEGDGAWRVESSMPLPFELREEFAVDISVGIQAKGTGQRQNRLLIRSNDPERPVLSIPVEALLVAEPRVSESVVGIDFGTTHSTICAARDGEAPQPMLLDETAPSHEERYLLPSVVYWSTPPQPGNLRDCVVGRMARQKAEHPDTMQATSASIKRRMGQPYKERILGVELAPEEIAARVIRVLLDAAEEYLGALVRHAVVTVPANFTPPQVRATVAACQMAGLDVEVERKALLDEPVAAAVEYLLGEQEPPEAEAHALVYDFGGGTLDISILRYTRRGEGASQECALDVVATKGDNAFGGDDLTEMLRQHLHKLAAEQVGGPVPADEPTRWDALPDARVRAAHVHNYVLLRTAAERIKRRLSFVGADDVERYNLDVELLAGRQAGKRNLTLHIARRDFEELIRGRLAATQRLLDRALHAAGLRAEQLSLALLTGQASRTPLVTQLLTNWLGLPPLLHSNPKLCVALGAYRKGIIDSTPEFGGVTRLVREMNRTPCRYGIIVNRRGGIPHFLALVGEGQPFPASGSSGSAIRLSQASSFEVAINQGDEDRIEENTEVTRIGKIAMGAVPLDAGVPLEVRMTVHDHHRLEIDLLVNGHPTSAATLLEY